jgi:predicted lipase
MKINEIIIKTSFIPPSVIKLYLYVCIRLYMFRFLANHLQKAYQHCKGNYHYMIHKYIKLVPTDFHVQVKM